MIREKSKIERVFRAVVIVLVTCLLFNACSMLGWPSKLDAPTLSLSGTVATWTNIEGADSYSLYDGETKIADVELTSGSTTSHDFLSNIDKTKSSHYFTVIAKGDGYFDSDASNQIAYTYVSDEGHDNEIDTSSQLIDNSGVNAPQNLVISSSQLTWDAIDDVSTYYVCFYVSGSDNTTIEVNGNSVSLSSLFGSSLENIISIRVGAIVDEKLCYGETVLCNKEDHGDYSEIFVFGNVLGDYYITDMAEFTEICYFAFVNRIEELNIQFSSSFTNSTSVNGITNSLSSVFGSNDSVGGFFETMSVSYQVTQSSSSQREYCIEFTYPSIEPTITSSTTYSYEVTLRDDDSQFMYGYYESAAVTTDSTLTARTSAYNSFVSDSFERLMEVETSEQLYWAIENGFTPTFPAGATESTCAALRLYNMAKDVLREIIYEGMTDYQKVRSIFDWICLNTAYDYAETGYSSLGIASNNNNMKCKAYYLEGVFEDGLAVCDGFSKAFSLLCNMEGIECIRVVGYGNGGGHAWNKVKIGESWYMCDITWTETTETERLSPTQVSFYEYLAHSYFLVPDDEDHEEFESAYTDAFQNSISASTYYSYWESNFIDVDKLVNNLKLNDIIEFLFNDSVGGTISDTISDEIQAFIYNNITPSFEGRRDYDDLLGRVIDLLELTYVDFESYMETLLVGDYETVSANITVSNLVAYLNSQKAAGLTTDYSNYYLDENKDFIIKDAEDFEILTLYVLYAGITDIEVLLYPNAYVNSLFNATTNTALQAAFDAIKDANPVFDIEFTGILGYYLNDRTSTAYVYGEGTYGPCRIIELYDRTGE